jgi:hypothetical protein
VRGHLKRRRIGATTGVALLGVVASAALLASGSAAAHPSSRPPAAPATRTDAHAARTLRATDTAHLHYVSASGSTLIEEGAATGTLPGKMRASVNVGTTISGNFTIYIRGGTVKGNGEAKPKGSGVYESFAGSVTVRGGTGRYAHARGHTGLYGTFDRQNYALVIQTTGTLSY